MKDRNAWACCIIHAMIEIVCFTILGYTFKIGTGKYVIIAILFDILAFFPQMLIGDLHEKFKKLDVGTISTFLMLLGIIIIDIDNVNIRSVLGISLIALSNAFLHDACAIQTTLTSKGRLFPSALFVAGGSFGLVIGQHFSKVEKLNKLYLIIPIIIIEILVLYTNKYWLFDNKEYPKFKIVNFRIPIIIIIVSAFLVTLTRSYIGYAIPISWKKEEWQSFALFIMMGTGKAFGGWLSDKIGAYKVGVFATLISIPFLIVGDNIMLVSIVGVFLFSMTMSITFGMLLSVIQENPGFAFGITTIALCIGLFPVLLFGGFSKEINKILVVVLSLACSYILYKTLNKEGNNE